MSDRFSEKLDKLSRSLAEESTRRGILRILGVGALLAPVAALSADDAEAKRKPRNKRDRDARQRQRERDRDRKQKQRERARRRKQKQRQRRRDRDGGGGGGNCRGEDANCSDARPCCGGLACLQNPLDELETICIAI